ncbi:hypothetical protein IWQ62_001689 [Dispira parvispora]|uniref:Uncharacterized protein n=1 Tax=Dispira parvispora TaxID=1520584 RepID=A0A9W8AXS1_9FUNG|nr:hypothetical protein IWQ62_001689 [Dispira parvispora]
MCSNSLHPGILVFTDMPVSVDLRDYIYQWPHHIRLVEVTTIKQNILAKINSPHSPVIVVNDFQNSFKDKLKAMQMDDVCALTAMEFKDYKLNHGADTLKIIVQLLLTKYGDTFTGRLGVAVVHLDSLYTTMLANAAASPGFIVFLTAMMFKSGNFNALWSKLDREIQNMFLDSMQSLDIKSHSPMRLPYSFTTFLGLLNSLVSNGDAIEKVGACSDDYSSDDPNAPEKSQDDEILLGPIAFPTRLTRNYFDQPWTYWKITTHATQIQCALPIAIVTKASLFRSQRRHIAELKNVHWVYGDAADENCFPQIDVENARSAIVLGCVPDCQGEKPNIRKIADSIRKKNGSIPVITWCVHTNSVLGDLCTVQGACKKTDQFLRDDASGLMSGERIPLGWHDYLSCLPIAHIDQMIMSFFYGYVASTMYWTTTKLGALLGHIPERPTKYSCGAINAALKEKSISFLGVRHSHTDGNGNVAHWVLPRPPANHMLHCEDVLIVLVPRTTDIKEVTIDISI